MRRRSILSLSLSLALAIDRFSRTHFCTHTISSHFYWQTDVVHQTKSNFYKHFLCRMLNVERLFQKELRFTFYSLRYTFKAFFWYLFSLLFSKGKPEAVLHSSKSAFFTFIAHSLFIYSKNLNDNHDERFFFLSFFSAAAELSRHICAFYDPQFGSTLRIDYCCSLHNIYAVRAGPYWIKYFTWFSLLQILKFEIWFEK